MRANRIWMSAAVTLLASMMVGPELTAAEWWESVKVKGDLRYRHEMLKHGDDNARHRHRLRARLGVFAEVSSYTNVGIQLASGSDDPVSTNQTLDGAFTTKQIGIDMAYFEASHGRLPGLVLTAGKFKNPFFKAGGSELIWDTDWNPEGGVITLRKKIEGIDVTLIGSGLWIDERESSDDSWLGAAQAVGRMYFDDKKTSVAVGAALFNYVSIIGFQPFYESDEAMGNSVTRGIIGDDMQDVYATDYDLLELYGEVTHWFEPFPVTVMGDYVINTAADSLETGWLVGLRAGKADRPGGWSFRYIYRRLEKDAVVGAFTDSDFRNGGTDARGHEIGGSLLLAENTAFNVTYFFNEIGLQEARTTDFQRLQVDLQLKF
ncbi:MAG: putative porin [Candidatus Zixiibacteriota bacterium]|nr:MAG: putative porin [candidate division Zixibacteria bacterium]